MDLELSNKRVLVTGASKGIDFEIAKHFLQEGVMVAISSRGQEHLTKAANELASVYGKNRIWSCACDFTDTESVISLASKIDALPYVHNRPKV
jgi:3-oxoacyl-[acyl-carrier protein] reductase